MHETRLQRSFFVRDVLEVAPDLLGKHIVVNKNGQFLKYQINEVEAYRGEEDLACHASKGKTGRNQIMYQPGGFVYVYLIYGMYWMLNFVTGDIDNPQAVLIRGVEEADGPGKLTRKLGIDKSFYGEDLTKSDRIWVENGNFKGSITTGKRIGIDYAGNYWKNKPWRYYII